MAATLLLAATTAATPSVPVQAAQESEWLIIVNRYRASAGLGPVREDPAASEAARLHSTYLVLNRTSGHDEKPGARGATAAGTRAGNSGNVYTGSGEVLSDRHVIEGWMTAPFHGLAMLNPKSSVFGFGRAGDVAWNAATLPVQWTVPKTPQKPDFDAAHAAVIAQFPDVGGRSWEAEWNGERIRVEVPMDLAVIRRFDVQDGIVREVLDAPVGTPLTADSKSSTIVWPGDGSSVPLIRYVGNENPNPLSACVGYVDPVGLPILIRRTRPTEISRVELTTGGQALEVCPITASTYRSPNASEQRSGRALLENNAIVIPRQPLVPGSVYRVALTFADGEKIAWSFGVSKTDAIGLPASHAQASKLTPGTSSQLRSSTIALPLMKSAPPKKAKRTR